MGHGCHDCGCPNGCECPDWVAFTSSHHNTYADYLASKEKPKMSAYEGSKMQEVMEAVREEQRRKEEWDRRKLAAAARTPETPHSKLEGALETIWALARRGSDDLSAEIFNIAHEALKR